MRAEELEQAIYGKIRERAYLLFEQSGREPGNEDANWLRAESEILRSGGEVRVSGSWVTLNVSIPDASEQGLQIAVRPRACSCVRGSKQWRGFLGASKTG